MKKETYNKILNGCKKMNEVEEILDNLQYGVDFAFVDEKIDDSCYDDCEDEYVMMRSYTFYLENGMQFYVRFYYGNNTGEIGTYEAKDETGSPNGSAFYGLMKRKLQELGGYHAFKGDEQFFVTVKSIADTVSKSVEVTYLYLSNDKETPIKLVDTELNTWDVETYLSDNDISRIMEELSKVKS